MAYKGVLILIDGNSLLHRCFHAFPSMKAPDGRPTNAVYGMLKLLINVVSQRRPTHLAVAFDVSRNSFRKREYPEYKANRKETDPYLIPQFCIIKGVLSSLNIPYFEKELYEADDIIGTLAVRASTGYKVEILTGDKDCIQLVNENVSVLLMKKGVSQMVECTPQSTENELGFRHDQVLSIKALAGDRSDNIPGVRGVGEKTAIELLRKYGTTEGVIAAIQDITGKQGEKIRAGIEMIRLSQQLATIFCKVPIDVDLESLRLRISQETGIEMLHRLGIRSLKVDELCLHTTKLARIPVRHNTGRITIPSTGSPNRCGICAKQTSCRQYVELNNNGKLAFGAKMFWGCDSCMLVLGPEYYKEIP